MALTAGAPDLGRSERAATDVVDGVSNGLGLVEDLAVIPHFDYMERSRAGAVERFTGWQPPGTTLVGIDEDTAMFGDGSQWRVEGRGAVWVLEPGGRRRVGPGEVVASAVAGEGAFG
jgi:cyanophycinase-like exopeptidase